MGRAISWTMSPLVEAGWPRTAVSPEPADVETDIAHLSDADLASAARDGRAGAFDLIVERHRRHVYQLCYRFVASHEDASDLSQEVFLRAYRGLRSFRGQSTLATWLYRISVNVCLNRVAVKVPRTEPIEERQHRDAGETASERVLRHERAAQVRAGIARLPPKQRAALVLRVYHDLSHQEIAETLGSSVGAVKANVFHALQSLKRILGEDGR